MNETDDPSGLELQVQDRLNFMKRLCDPTVRASRKIFPEVPLFVVARRWSSWYPSYFEVEGGCYAMVDTNSDVTVIDPGFDFLSTLRFTAQIEPQNIRQIIVTHFHPDHSVGLEQFLTFAFEAHLQSDLFLNETSYSFYKDFHGDRIRIHELAPGKVFRIPAAGMPDGKDRILITPFQTHHSEIGLRHKALGLQVDMCSRDNITHRLTMLGDTDGREEYLDEYAKHIDSKTNIALLHLGTFATPATYGSGTKHLYKRGVEMLLDRIGQRIANYPSLELVLISEFGFEMASRLEIVEKMAPFYRPRRGQMILFMISSSLEQNSSDFERFLFAHLVYKAIVDTAGTMDYMTEPDRADPRKQNRLQAYDLCKAWCEIALPWSMGLSSLLWSQSARVHLEDWVDKNIPKATLQVELDEFAKNTEFDSCTKSELGQDIYRVVERLFTCSGDDTATTLDNIASFGRKMYRLSRETSRVLGLLPKERLHDIEKVVSNSIDNLFEIISSLNLGKKEEIGSYRTLLKLSCLAGGLLCSAGEDLRKDRIVARMPEDVRYQLTTDGSIPIKACQYFQSNTALGRRGIPILPADMGLVVSFGKGLRIRASSGEMLRPSQVRVGLDEDLHVLYVRA